MRWLIVYLLLIAVIWLFVTNRVWRRSLLVVATVLFGVFMLVFTLTQRELEEDVKTAETFSQVQKLETLTHGTLKPGDIGIGRTSFTNPQHTVFDSAGRERTEPDLFTWLLATAFTNRSEQLTVGSLSLRATLYSCPVFYDVPQEDVDPGKLDANCTVIGRRTVGFNPLRIDPGDTVRAEQVVTFPNQPDPRNPRYWIEVQTVTATRPE